MKKSITNISLGILAGALLCGAPMSSADETRRDPASGAVKDRPADNTGVNKRDREALEPTAEQQKNNRSDLELTRLIRRTVVTDKGLSLYAHNIKIITQNGVVTLKGPVRSEEEKQVIEKKAAAIAGAAQIKNELEVAPKN